MGGKDETITNLNELVRLLKIKVGGLEAAVNYMRKRERKTLNELELLKRRYDSEVERDVMENVINLVKEIMK